MLQELGQQTPPTLSDLATAAPQYLARAGIHPFTDDLHVGTNEILAALAGGYPPRLVLELSGTSAALLDTPAPSLPAYGTLFLLFPAPNSPFATDIARLLAAYRTQGITPIAVTQNEGVLPHLLTLPGAHVDVAAIPGYDPTKGCASLCGCGRYCLLFVAPHELRSTLLSSGARICAIGALSETECLSFSRAGFPLFSLSIPFLRRMQEPRVRSLTLHDADAPNTAPRFAESNTELLCGMDLTAPREQDLLHLLCEAARRGADIAHATVALTLELPYPPSPHALGTALPLLLCAHRTCAELTLPATTPRILHTNVSAPRLSVFLAAPRTAPQDVTDVADFKSARALFYGN